MTVDTKLISPRPLPTPSPARATPAAPVAQARNAPASQDSFQTPGARPARAPVAAAAQQPSSAVIEAGGAAGQQAAPKVIDVYFHVITRGEGPRNGDVSQAQIDQQLKVLNDAYKDAGFQFNLAAVDRTQNAQWYSAGMETGAEAEMKQTLRKGDASDLNIYTTSPGEGLLGWATFPEEYQGAEELDGVVLLNSSLPGGSGAPYNEGDTGVHEVGHWMGLFHTFTEPPEGDLVDDTPAHEPNYGTPAATTDTLPDLPGNDPVHNYMNYTDDAWMSEFTPGQVERMQDQWEQFRDPSDSPRVA